MLLYDKAGEEHYNLISALHKSVRNSDPDASLYWLGRMLEAGEDPLYVARRLVRMAVEDIGSGRTQRVIALHGSARCRRFSRHARRQSRLGASRGLSGGAPKSNALYTAYGEVQADVERTAAEAVPLHLRNAPTGLMKRSGYGKATSMRTISITRSRTCSACPTI